MISVVRFSPEYERLMNVNNRILCKHCGEYFGAHAGDTQWCPVKEYTAEVIFSGFRFNKDQTFEEAPEHIVSEELI